MFVLIPAQLDPVKRMYGNFFYPKKSTHSRLFSTPEENTEKCQTVFSAIKIRGPIINIVLTFGAAVSGSSSRERESLFWPVYTYVVCHKIRQRPFYILHEEIPRTMGDTVRCHDVPSPSNTIINFLYNSSPNSRNIWFKLSPVSEINVVYFSGFSSCVLFSIFRGFHLKKMLKVCFYVSKKIFECR